MSIWQTLAGAFFGSLVAAAVVAWFTQKWTEGRERRNRRDNLRLDLYLKIVDLVLDNDLLLAKRTAEGDIPPIEIQRKWFGAEHRLKLLGSQPVKDAYHVYYTLVHKEVDHPIQFRPEDPNEVYRARDRLIELMASDVANEVVRYTKGNEGTRTPYPLCWTPHSVLMSTGCKEFGGIPKTPRPRCFGYGCFSAGSYTTSCPTTTYVIS